MPFAGYKDFADCVRRNRDKDNPQAFCGEIQHRVEKRRALVRKLLRLIRGPRNGTPEKAEKSDIRWAVQISKLDEEKRIVYGPVLEPGVEDAQGDIVSKEEIRKAAHNFMRKVGMAEAGADGVMHKGRVGVDAAYLVESWLQDGDTKHGEQSITDGTWMIGVHVPDDELWGLVKSGEFTGFSIGGQGMREPL